MLECISVEWRLRAMLRVQDGRPRGSESTGDATTIGWRVWLERDDQVRIAAISGPAPKIAVVRFRS